MSNERSQPDKDSSELSSISYRYIKSNYFRVIHADGIWGGLTPALKVQMAFFSERSAIPEVLTMAVEDDKIGKEIDRVSKGGIVREVETSVVMDLDVARSFVNWLNEKITQAEGIKKKNNPEVASNENRSKST
jgi:hypothetical protein